LPDPKADATTAIVKIAAASITPSDVKNVEGSMEHTTLPRVPGRDYASKVRPNGWAPRSGELAAKLVIRSMVVMPS
jgi:NADPH:quinone reductase